MPNQLSVNDDINNVVINNANQNIIITTDGVDNEVSVTQPTTSVVVVNDSPNITIIENNVEGSYNDQITVSQSTLGTSIVSIVQPDTTILVVNSPGPQGPVGPQGPQGPAGTGTIDTSSFVTTSSFNAFTSSYYVDSASFNTRINSISVDTSSLVTTSSFNALTSSFNSFTSSYNTGSFSGSIDFANTASYVTGSIFTSNNLVLSSSYALTASRAEVYPNVINQTISFSSNFLTTSVPYTFTNHPTTIIIKGSVTNVNTISTFLRLQISSSTGTTEYDRITINQGGIGRYSPFTLAASFNNISGPGFILLNSIPSSPSALSASFFNTQGVITIIPNQ